MFDFCCKYNYRVEYVRVAETLHSHFNQIIKMSKHPELFVQSKIPFPIKLDEEDALQKALAEDQKSITDLQSHVKSINARSEKLKKQKQIRLLEQQFHEFAADAP